MGACASAAAALASAREPDADKAHLPALLAALGGEISTRAEVARAVRGLFTLASDDAMAPQMVRQGAFAALQRVVQSARVSAGLRRDALLALERLAMCYEGAAVLTQGDFLDVLLRMLSPAAPPAARKSRGRMSESADALADAPAATGAFAAEVGAVLVAAAGDADGAAALLEHGGCGAALALARALTQPPTSRVGLRLLARLAAAPGGGGAEALCDAAGGAAQLATLCLSARAAASHREKVDWENGACLAMAHLARAHEPFADALLAAGGVAPLVAAAKDDIPSRRAAAGYALACLAAHKRLRPALLRARCLQLFVALAATSSKRADLADCQRVAGLGLANLCATYHFRAAAAKAGALEAALALLHAQSAAVRAGGAAAVAALALHEDNGRRLCFGGALPALLQLARSGEARGEAAAVRALSALALNADNAAALVREGGTQALLYATSSDNPATSAAARQLLHRLRLERLRGAARLAGAAAAEAARMKEEHGSLAAAVDAVATADAHAAVADHANAGTQQQNSRGAALARQAGGKERGAAPAGRKR